MGKALIIGCGGVASVAIHKCCQNSEVFEEICIASRTKSKCDELKAKLDGGKTKITTAQIDANNVDELIALINMVKPDIVMNLALPYQDLTIMDACLATKTNYMDTANYEPEDTAKFEYKWQWDYRERFEKAGVTALLGSGFDPGVTGVFSAYALKHHFDEIEYIDILDCNAGDHGYPFATNFNPEINIREVSAKGRYWEKGKWIETEPMEIKRVYHFDEVGERDMYLLYHEELESLALNIPGLKRIRFFMTFGQSYLNHLKCLENVGMTSITPIEYEGKQIIPLQFLKAVLPDPSSLGPRTKGKTNISCIFQGKKDGKDKTYYVYNVCDHEECYQEVGSQAVAYTTGVPAMIGAMMLMTGKWNKPGVYNIEEFDPDPFMDELNKWGLPWKENFTPVLVDSKPVQPKEEEQVYNKKFEELPTPCYVIDEELLKKNLKILNGVMKRTGCKILLAQKAFSMYSMYPLIGQYLSGTTASGLFEARLGHEEMKKENHIFAPAYRENEIDEIITLCDHIVFNSFSQLEKFKDKVLKTGKKVGLRINPECSTQVGHVIYDPCAPHSRLGVTKEHFRPELLEGVSGLHFHTLCQQNSNDLETTITAVEEKFGPWLSQMEWINFGGGHHITRQDYDVRKLETCIKRMKDKYGLEVYLEPGEAVALDAGFLVTTVLDTHHNGMEIAILDTSATCHMPDVLEMPYRPPLLGSGKVGEKPFLYRLGGPTCLSGDIIGDYSFEKPLKSGDRLVFDNMAVYTIVKNNTFNGMPLPAIAIKNKTGEYHLLNEFGYHHFKTRLG